MTSTIADFIHIIKARGYLHQCSDEEGLRALLHTGPVTAYVGYDCTAPSLHIGSLLSIMMLRWFQKTGNRPIVLMGGGTTRVGDPSGKDEARKILSNEAINANMSSLRNIFSNYIQFGEGPSDGMMLNNNDWLDGLNYIHFLRDYGRHFSVNRMLSMDSVRLRLEREQPLSFLEFNYMILQAYDFVELHKRYGCTLQMGGSDQWGNIVHGVDLGRRVAGASLYALTSPLLTTASGAKMGKTAEGTVWLSADMLSPSDFWQYWRNTEDADVGRFLRLFTELPPEEIARLEVLEGVELNAAKKILATHVTALCHGQDAADAAATLAKTVFEDGVLDDNLPTITLPEKDARAGTPLYTLLCRMGFCASNGEARRLIKGGGVRVDDQRIDDDTYRVVLTRGACIKLSAGKKRHGRVEVS